MTDTNAANYLELWDFRQRVVTLYNTRNQAWRQGNDERGIWRRFRQGRDRLFAEHSQSALSTEDGEDFQGLPYFPYDPSACVEARVSPHVEPSERSVPLGEGETVLRAAARLIFTLYGQELELTLYWIDVYGGGLFLPFRDQTTGNETYGGGRYLLDTVKGAIPVSWSDPQRRMLLDFNYAYNPSCAYSPHWICPLAPMENTLPVALRAGEQAPRTRAAALVEQNAEAATI